MYNIGIICQYIDILWHYNYIIILYICRNIWKTLSSNVNVDSCRRSLSHHFFFQTQEIPSWWLQPHWKIIRQIGNPFPNFLGENTKEIFELPPPTGVIYIYQPQQMVKGTQWLHPGRLRWNLRNTPLEFGTSSSKPSCLSQILHLLIFRKKNQGHS